MIAAAHIRNTRRAIERKAVAKYMDGERHDASNKIAAQAILENPEKYQGAMLMWARAFTERVK